MGTQELSAAQEVQISAQCWQDHVHSFLWHQGYGVNWLCMPCKVTVTGVYYADMHRWLKLVKEKHWEMLSASFFYSSRQCSSSHGLGVKGCHSWMWNRIPQTWPSEFHMFLYLKCHLKGNQFSSSEELQSTKENWLNEQNKNFCLKDISNTYLNVCLSVHMAEYLQKLQNREGFGQQKFTIFFT